MPKTLEVDQGEVTPIIDIRTVKGLETESISGQRRVSLMNNHKQFRQLLAQCAQGQIAAVLRLRDG